MTLAENLAELTSLDFSFDKKQEYWFALSQALCSVGHAFEFLNDAPNRPRVFQFYPDSPLAHYNFSKSCLVMPMFEEYNGETPTWNGRGVSFLFENNQTIVDAIQGSNMRDIPNNRILDGSTFHESDFLKIYHTLFEATKLALEGTKSKAPDAKSKLYAGLAQELTLLKKLNSE
jgi:hypothetical protein